MLPVICDPSSVLSSPNGRLLRMKQKLQQDSARRQQQKQFKQLLRRKFPKKSIQIEETFFCSIVPAEFDWSGYEDAEAPIPPFECPLCLRRNSFGSQSSISIESTLLKEQRTQMTHIPL